MNKTVSITVRSCKECPYLRYPWNSAVSKYYACGYHAKGFVRPVGDQHWLGGSAEHGDRVIIGEEVDVIQDWCELLVVD